MTSQLNCFVFLFGFFLSQDPILHAVIEIFHTEFADKHFQAKNEEGRTILLFLLFVTSGITLPWVAVSFLQVRHSVVRAETLYSRSCPVLGI